MSLPAILLVGCGRMGGALAAGWLARGATAVMAVDPAGTAPPGVTLLADAGTIPADFTPAAIVLAVKPQMAAASLPAYARFATGGAGGPVFVSIMAGQTLAGMAARLGPAAAIVRAMPNTPAAIGQGATVACAGPGVGAARRALAGDLLAAVGAVAWVEDEALMDAVTAVSGSGPAYVFLLAELLAAAAREPGLPAALARLRARRTVAGAGALLAASEEDAAALRRAVTSPAGTTAAALEVLMAPAAWPGTLSRAVAAATHRSRELAG